MNNSLETLTQLDILSTYGVNIAHNVYKRIGLTLEQAVEDLQRLGHIGPKQAAEILVAKKLIVVTSYVDDGLYYKSAGITVDEAVDRVLKVHNSILAIW